MSDISRIPETSLAKLSAGAMEVIRHLCEGECHTFASVLQWCETRGDCVYAVQCPGCTTQFILDEDDLIAIERWSAANGSSFSCGIRESA
jgi:hypothetical protein